MRARAIFGSLSGCAVAVSLTLAATSAPCLAAAALAVPEPPPQAPAGPTIDTLIEEAARRFAVPALWIRAVMRQESGFDPHATSHAGAMGLMQVMPATYAELRRRHGLGPDPYDPRDNVLAGAAYLRELYDRFGPEGMLPAYNAGPGRYLQHRDQGRPLPVETRDYIARIGARIGVQGSTPDSPLAPRIAAPAPVDHNAAPLFPGSAPSADPVLSGLFAPLGASAGLEPVRSR